MLNSIGLPCPAFRAALLVAIGTLLVARLPAQTESPRATNSTPKSETQQPIPRDGISDEMKKLIDEGKVEVVYDSEPEFVKAARGWADFHIQLHYSFKYDLTKTRKNGRWQVKVVVNEIRPTIELTHIIRLPNTFKTPGIWNSRVMRHEFDHVAVSLDPRAMLLFKHLVEHLPVIEQTLEPKETPTNAVVNKLVDAEIVKRRQAIVELMRQNNLRLDNIGAHGAQVVPNRAAFFTQLYTKDNLAEMKFPFIEQVLKRLDSPEYQRAESDLKFLPRDPAQ